MKVVGRSSAAFVASALLLLAGCTPNSSSPSSSAISQARLCGRLTQDACAQVVAAVEAQVPGARSSMLAVADYATPVPATGSATTYLVSFKPWDSGDPWMNPPTWRVSGSPNGLTLTPAVDVKDLSVCFILLLRDAGLTDYAPTFPSGICG
jgi:hypothetical protein